MAKKASDNLKYYHNPNGPTIGTVSRRVKRPHHRHGVPPRH